MTTQQTTFAQMMQGPRPLVVPEYILLPRWGETQWDALLQTLLPCACTGGGASPPSSAPHTGGGKAEPPFLGSVIVSADHLIIDGNQRLAALAMLLFAAGELVYPEDEAYALPLYGIQTPTGTLADLLLKEEAGAGSGLKAQLLHSLAHMRRQLQALHKMQQQALALLPERIAGAVLVLIQVPRPDGAGDPAALYLDISAPGKRLDMSDLLKGYLFRHSGTQARQLRSAWADLRRNAPVTLDDVFLQDFFLYRFGLYAGDAFTGLLLERYLQQGSSLQFVEDMGKAAAVYHWFLQPEACEDAPVRAYLHSMKRYGLHAYRPLVMLALGYRRQGRADKGAYLRFLQALANFAFLYHRVYGADSLRVRRELIPAAYHILSDGQPRGLERVLQLLKALLPYPVFETAFCAVAFSRKNKDCCSAGHRRLARDILKGFEAFYQRQTGELRVACTTIEHIGGDDGSPDHCRIGNLLPLGKQLNEKVKDWCFARKAAVYEQSNLASVRGFLRRYGASRAWTREDIHARGRQMAQAAYRQVWRFW